MRFISEDTYKGKIGNPATLNLYAYCGGNPVMLYDPSGNSWETLLDIAGAIVSLYDFVNDPTWANAGYLVWDIAAVIAPMVPGSYVNDIAKIRKLDDGMNLVEYGDEVLELAGGGKYIDDCGQNFRIVCRLSTKTDPLERKFLFKIDPLYIEY